jgi:type II secretory pathway pseudopilin PulG
MFNNKFNSVLSRRHGLSLIEIMIAMVMTLIVLGAMMAAFSYGSAEMAKGRASIELNNRLISSEEQLRRDLDRITVELKPYQQSPTQPKGYFEIVDGPETDYNAANEIDPFLPYLHSGNELVYGDRDDYLGCTIKSDGKAFRGRRDYTGPMGPVNDIAESHLAEIAWFSIDMPGAVALPGSATNRASTSNQMVCRRQLLILPSLGVLLTTPTLADVNDFFARNDISARLDTLTGNLVANSLQDLTIRGNRYCHSVPSGVAGNPASNPLQYGSLPLRYNSNHVMFTSVASFDIQVFAPDATVNVIATAAGISDIAEPFDIGANKAGAIVGTPIALGGAYVDLGKGTGFFGGPMRSSTNCNYATNGQFLYDTGTSLYNRNDAADDGSNGIDDAGIVGVIDDWQEQDSIAPYNAPIRGLKFTMRVLEPNTKQVRQLTVKKSFVAQ